MGRGTVAEDGATALPRVVIDSKTVISETQQLTLKFQLGSVAALAVFQAGRWESRPCILVKHKAYAFFALLAKHPDSFSPADIMCFLEQVRSSC